MESSWIDVPVAEVAVGDEVKVDGIGFRRDPLYPVEYNGVVWDVVTRVLRDSFSIRPVKEEEWFRRSSIVAVRRRKPEPAPKPGDWRCYEWDGVTRTYGPCRYTHHPRHEGREVYRASSGWSKDTRTGQPWVMKTGDPVEVVVEAVIGVSVGGNLRMAWSSMSGLDSGESWSDYYRRIGLDVRPVERRGKQ